jgi:hypothetical protein
MNPAIAERDQVSPDGDLLDAISAKTKQLHSLAVILMFAAEDESVPRDHLGNVCWLACDLSAHIAGAIDALAMYAV